MNHEALSQNKLIEKKQTTKKKDMNSLASAVLMGLEHLDLGRRDQTPSQKAY